MSTITNVTQNQKHQYYISHEGFMKSSSFPKTLTFDPPPCILRALTVATNTTHEGSNPKATMFQLIITFLYLVFQRV